MEYLVFSNNFLMSFLFKKIQNSRDIRFRWSTKCLKSLWNRKYCACLWICSYCRWTHEKKSAFKCSAAFSAFFWDYIKWDLMGDAVTTLAIHTSQARATESILHLPPDHPGQLLPTHIPATVNLLLLSFFPVFSWRTEVNHSHFPVKAFK